MIVRSGRRSATAATTAASSGSAPRSSAPGGSPAPARTASTAGSSREPAHREGIEGGGTSGRDRPAGLDGDPPERGEGPFRGGNHRKAARRAATYGHRRDAIECVRVRTDGHCHARVDVDEPLDELAAHDGAADRGRQRERAEQAPTGRQDAPQALRKRWRRADIEREEGSRVARHRAHASGASGQASQATRFVELPETDDQHLDARIIREDLAGRGQAATEEPAQRRVEEQHRVRPERAVRPACLEEADGWRRQPAQLDLAGDLLHELIALLVAGLESVTRSRRPRQVR